MEGAARYFFQRQGKVRDVYSTEDNRFLLIVDSERISAFDHVLPSAIPDKGATLTRLSNFGFQKTRSLIPDHVVTGAPALDDWLYDGRWWREDLARRSVLVKRAKPPPVEAIVRGSLVGPGWKGYRQAACVCGIRLPKGLIEADRLPEAIFTPSTKADAGNW